MVKILYLHVSTKKNEFDLKDGLKDPLTLTKL